MRHLFRTVTLRRYREHPLRTALTLTGVALGVAANIAVQMILATMTDSFSSMIDAVAGKVELQITGGEAGVAEELYERLSRGEAGEKAVPGVAAVIPTIQTVTKFAGENLLILAVDTLNDSAARSYRMTDASGAEVTDPLEFLNAVDTILVARDFANRHGVTADSTIELLTSQGRKPFQVKGFLEAEGPATAFGGNFALMDVYAAQAYFGRAGRFDAIDIVAEKGADVAAVKAALEAELGGAYDVQRPEQRNEGVDAMLANVRMGLLIMTFVVVAMGGFIIFNTITTSVYQRMREIGLLRMLGVTRLGIGAVFAIEGIILGLAGAVLGVAAGYAIGRVTILRYINDITSLLVPANTTHASFDGEMIGSGLAIGLFISLIGALWPSFRAARVSPLDVVRYGPGLSSGQGAQLTRWTVVAGIAAALLAIALFYPPIAKSADGVRAAMAGVLVLAVAVVPLFMRGFLGAFSRVTAAARHALPRMASDNLRRDLGRSAMTVAAFMVALAVMFEIYLFMNSMKREIRDWMDNILQADIFVSSSNAFATRNSVPMDPEMGRELEKIPGVKHAVELRMRLHDYEAERILLLSIDFTDYFNRKRLQFPDGWDEDAAARFRNNEGVLLSQNFVTRTPPLASAKTIRLMTPAGARDVPILGTIVDYASETGTVMLNRGLYLELFRDPLVDTFHVYLKDGADLEGVRHAIDELSGDRFDLFALSNRDFKKAIFEALEQIFALAVSLEILTIVIAVIGIINNLLANVIDRTREIGVLRSLGATRGQVGRIFFVQSGLMGFSGAVIGGVAGLALAHIHLQRLNVLVVGWKMPLHASGPIVAGAFVGSILLAIAAGLLPARRAANLTVRDALKYE
ncbi:ABC transporter permease [bacterium]|nr:ABC transporter permease [bacterium]